MLNTLIALLILIWFGDHVITEGVSKINLNTINFALFGLGLLFHDSPHSYIESVKEGATTVYGVIIQFPLYAGISADYLLRPGRRNYGAVHLHRDAGNLSVDRIHLHWHHGLLRPVCRV